MKKMYKKIIALVCSVSALALPLLVLAANPARDKLNEVATNKGPYKESTLLADVIGGAVSVALSLIGIIFLLLMIYAGYNWMTAQGEEEKVTKAKSTIIQSVIGIVIVVGAYAAWRFLFSRLLF